MNKRIKRVALAGMLSAVALVLMTIGSVITVLDMTAAFAAGFAVIIAMIETDRLTAIGVYAVSGILAFVLLPNKFSAITFICYGGLYPIIKELCEKIHIKWLSWTMKFVASNVLLTGVVLLGRCFVTAGEDPLGFEIWVYVLGNFVFVAYDIALTMIISKYYTMFKRRP